MTCGRTSPTRTPAGTSSSPCSIRSSGSTTGCSHGYPSSGRLGSAAVHPPCAIRHLGLARKLDAVAHALADDVTTPLASTCCGFAGDRGFLHPELTASATRGTASELAGRKFDAHLCSNRTCEIGLQQATGAAYASFVYALEELTRDGAVA